MAENDLIMTLGKVIIAAAWADGEITNDEVNCLKDLIYRLPDISARQWDELAIYMDSPISDAERARLVAELTEETRSADQRTLVLDTLNNMAVADGATSPQEEVIIDEVRNAVTSADTGIWGTFSRMLIGKRSEAVTTGPNREAQLDDFINNRVYYEMRRHLADANLDVALPDAELRRLGLMGGLMALVAEVSPDITEGEKAAMAAALHDRFDLTAEQAAYVTDLSLSPEVGNLDFYRLVRGFAEEYDLEERKRFLATLFAVAAADGMASFDEIEQLRIVAQGLKLTHEEFIEAKLTSAR
ncbi:MAG: TerB family tellurite resistance protein [Chloroflexota bacterium]